MLTITPPWPSKVIISETHYKLLPQAKFFLRKSTVILSATSSNFSVMSALPGFFLTHSMSFLVPDSR